MSNDKNDFFLHSNEVNHIAKEDYDKIELLVNTAKAFARSTYQCVYIIDYFHQGFIYASDNLAYLCGLQPEQLLEAGYQMYIDHVPELLSDDGRIWLAFCTVSLAATDEPGHIIMQKNGERGYFEYSTDRHKWERKEGITLSEAEREVLRLSAQGYTMNEIADRVCKSVDTIKACKRSLFAKLGVKNIAEALFHAVNYQMI